jgi:hypothetical protein
MEYRTAEQSVEYGSSFSGERACDALNVRVCPIRTVSGSTACAGEAGIMIAKVSEKIAKAANLRVDRLLDLTFVAMNSSFYLELNTYHQLPFGNYLL